MSYDHIICKIAYHLDQLMVVLIVQLAHFMIISFMLAFLSCSFLVFVDHLNVHLVMLQKLGIA